MADLQIDVTQLLNRKQAADYLRSLRCSISTARSLGQLASDGGGPPYVMDGNRAMYLKSDLEKWRMERLRPR